MRYRCSSSLLIVRHGETGYTLPPQAPTSDWAAPLAQAVENPDAYRAMARASRADYEARLNWDAFGARLYEILGRVAGDANCHAVAKST